MKRILSLGLLAGVLLSCLAGCGLRQGSAPSGATSSAGVSKSESAFSSAPSGESLPASAPQSEPAAPVSAAPAPSAAPSEAPADAEIRPEDALAIALENAGVPAGDAYNIKNETDGDNGIPLYDIEFETDYGDYDFSVAIHGGRIVGADYEVDEEWLDTLGGSPVSLVEAAAIAAGKVPGASAADVDIREESGDGRGRYEGVLFFDGMQYEFEIDPPTGRIFDWNADLRS